MQLVQWNTQLGTPQRLTVSAGSHQLLSERVALKEITEHGPCGDVDYWGLNVRVDDAGQVKILGWSRGFLQPATTIPTPSAIPSTAP